MTNVPEGTLQINIKGCPTTKQELLDLLAILCWEVAMGDPEDQPYPAPPGEENYSWGWLCDMRFELPYGQGGGFLEIEKLTLEQAQAAHTDEADPQTPWGLRQEEVGGLEYTGWCVLDHYTDSMTNEFWSPVFRYPDGSLNTWEM